MSNAQFSLLLIGVYLAGRECFEEEYLQAGLTCLIVVCGFTG